MRKFHTFSWKDSNLRIACDKYDLVYKEIVNQRTLLEKYILSDPVFQSSMTPLASLKPNAPIIAKLMNDAAKKTGLGPMASVAGILAQFGAEKAFNAGCVEAIVENGGDMFIFSDKQVTVGIYAGNNVIGKNLAFRINPEDMPLAICSSSSHMGHSISLGNCDLATVVSADAALADSAATLVCNEIKQADDIENVLNRVGNISGIRGILAIKNDKIGLFGKLPEIVRNYDIETEKKITIDKQSNFSP